MYDLTRAFLTLPDIELGPSRYFQDVLQDSSIIIAGKLSAESKCFIYDLSAPS